MSRESAHAKVRQWTEGGYQVQRFAQCRCGFTVEHYNRGRVNELFRLHVAHQDEREHLIEGTGS